MASGVATVKEVISGDTLVLVGVPKGGPPPEKRVSLSSVVAPRVAMKSLTHETPDEPYGWPAREFLRNYLIGQQVTFKIEFAMNGKEYACVCYKGENVACELLRRGLAKVRDNKNPPQAHDLQELEACEAEAKARQLGLHSSDPGTGTVRSITWGVGDSSFASEFANKHRGQELPAVVEYVRDGGAMRVAIRLSKEEETPPAFAYCAVSLAGIQCPTTRRDAEGNSVQEPFAAEARFFVEIRLLNRDITLRVEGSDDFGNLLGSVLHPNGDIRLLLLLNGFAKVNNATVQLTGDPARLRQAMKEAQANRLRRWKDLPTSSSSDGLEKVYFAQVEEVVSGDSVVLTLPGDQQRRVYFASIRCMRPGNPSKPQPREEESLALEAKELVRKKAIGKIVKVFLEYVKSPFTPASGGPPPPGSDSQGNLHFVSIYVGSPKLLGVPEEGLAGKATEERRGQNLTELLLQAGLAKTVPHRAEDDQAERYDVYQTLQSEAQAAKRGVFAPPQEVKITRIVDLVGPGNTQRALAHLQQLQRHANLEAIVENVFNAARFRLRVPSQKLNLSFALSGIKCPQTARAAASFPGGPKERQGEPFGAEALRFARCRVLQREVIIQVEQCDRGGNFIGNLLYGQQKTNLAAELLEAGLAQVVPFSADRAACRELLLASEAKAKSAKRCLWSLPGALEEEHAQQLFAETTLLGVTVAHVERFDLFYLREERSGELSRLREELLEATRDPPSSGETFTLGGLPRKGEVILGLHAKDGQWYRGRVESRDSTKVTLFLIDEGIRETLGIDKLRRCPSSLGAAAVPPQAIPCAFSGLLPPPEMEPEAAEALRDLVSDQVFHCLVENLDEERRRRCVLTTEEEHADKGLSVNEKLLAMGLALFDRKSATKFASRFQAEEQKARKQHLNVWRYGDIDADEDDYDAFPAITSTKRAPGRR
ncbi:hypothetical protein Efla_005647 [Eimeria flavescens]